MPRHEDCEQGPAEGDQNCILQLPHHERPSSDSPKTQQALQLEDLPLSQAVCRNRKKAEIDYYQPPLITIEDSDELVEPAVRRTRKRTELDHYQPPLITIVDSDDSPGPVVRCNRKRKKINYYQAPLSTVLDPDGPFEMPGTTMEQYQSFVESQKRLRSPTPPFDDYPVPDVDDMSIDPKFMTYTKNVSGTETEQTPAEFEEEREAWIRKRNLRREREDKEMFRELKAFKRSRQRGWNGKSEAKDRAGEEKRREDRIYDQSPLHSLAPYPPTIAKELESGCESFQSQYIIGRIASEDQVDVVQNQGYKETVKSRWDLEADKESVSAEHSDDIERRRSRNRRRRFGRNTNALIRIPDDSDDKDDDTKDFRSAAPSVKIRIRKRGSLNSSKKRSDSSPEHDEEAGKEEQLDTSHVLNIVTKQPSDEVITIELSDD